MISTCNLKKKKNHTSPGGASLPGSRKDLSSQSRCFGFSQSTLETHRKSEQAEVWETEDAKASQQGSTATSLGRGNQPPASPSSARSFAINRWQRDTVSWGETGPPGGLGPWLLFLNGTLAGKAQKRKGLEEEREMKHVHVQMRNLELAFPK